MNNTVPYDAQQLPDIQSALKADKEEAKKPQEPLPEVPQGPLTVDQAYAFLGVADADRGQLDKVKMRFRKMSLKYHPDKNMGREEAAAEVFRAVHAAYHTLTTNNFDYKRWAEAFTVPPLQTLEEVLMMALKGEDPMKIEIMLQKRGEYRPHQEFGINLAVPWSAGTKADPSYDVSAGSAYTTTQALHDGTRQELGYSSGGGPSTAMTVAPLAHQMVASNTQDLIESLGAKAQLGADAEARPWEAVAMGRKAPPSKSYVASTYQAPAGRPDLTEKSKDAKMVAEEYNDRAVQVRLPPPPTASSTASTTSPTTASSDATASTAPASPTATSATTAAAPLPPPPQPAPSRAPPHAGLPRQALAAVLRPRLGGDPTQPLQGGRTIPQPRPQPQPQPSP